MYIKRKLVIAVAAALGLSACGGGGSSSTGGTTATGFAIPTEISAVPTDNSSAAASLARGLTSQLRALSRAVSLPADSDYNKTSTRKYIEEHSLEQFSIIETIMKAVAQTHYADAGNINAGPYKAMVAWEDNQGGVDMKILEPWVVDSAMITINGQQVNRLRAWIEEVDGGTPRVIKAQFDIYQSATQNADGSYADYGVWDLNVKFNDAATDFFVASARIENGVTVLKINHSETRQDGGMPQPVTFTTQAVMHRAGTQGYGQVAFDDMDCSSMSCVKQSKNVKYAYNANYVGLQEGSDPEVYKDRTSQTELTHRYGLFYADAGTDDNGNAIAAGDNLSKHKSFGFPVSYDDNGVRRHAYYGAWQGRHQLWGGGPNGAPIPAGTAVTREDRGPNQAAETYYVSSAFTGTLTKRTLAQGSLNDIVNIPVETWINKHYDMKWDAAANSGAGAWMYCSGFMDFSTMPPTCKDSQTMSSISFTQFTDFGQLMVGQNDRKNVNIGRWDQTANTQKDYVYLAADPSINGFTFTGAGFYEGTRSNMGGMTPNVPAVKFSPADGDNLRVDIGGSIYIAYTGQFSGPATTTGWVQKKLASFDQQTWTPTFAAGADTEFVLERGRDYYINSRGANFVVKKVAASTPPAVGDYEVMIELQTAANPVNFSSILPAGTSYLRAPWRPEARYTLETTPGANFLKLVHANPDTQTPPKFNQGEVLNSGEWGLQAYGDNGTPSDFTDDKPLMADGSAVTVDQYGIPTNPSQRPVQFNWEYSADGGWGTQTFLCATQTCAAAADYKLLSDPVSLSPITVANGAGESKTLSLQFDGWMHGLPDLYQELSKSGWKMTADISNKIVTIPAGTSVTDSNGVGYYVKPLEVSVFLNEVDVNTIPAGSVPDLTLVSPTELNSLPVFAEHSMGVIPTNADGTPLAPKYSEGNPVE